MDTDKQQELMLRLKTIISSLDYLQLHLNETKKYLDNIINDLKEDFERGLNNV